MSSRALPRPAVAASPDLLQEGLRCFNAAKFPEAQACFERMLRASPQHPLALWNLGRTLLEQNQYTGAATVMQQAVAARPKAPEPRFALGMALQALNRPEEAAASFRAAADLRPGWAEAWSHLGHALGSVRRFAEAETALRHAVTFPTYRAETLNHLGVLSSARGQPAAAVEWFLQAIPCNPKLYQAWSNLGNALRALNQLEEASVAYRQSLALNPKNAFVKFNLALVHLLQGRLTRDAWLKYEYRWVALNSNPHRGFAQPLWRGTEPIAGKSILLYPEQGLGDTIQFIRYAAILAAQGATVHVEVQAALKDILQGTPGTTSIIAQGEPLPPFDLHCPLLSVPFALDTRIDTIPAPTAYLEAPADRVEKWRDRLGPSPRFRVGVVWRGNPQHANDANRSIPLEMFRRVFDAASCDYVSLQLGPAEKETAILSAHGNCVDLTDQISDFTDTAALMAQLDLVLAVDTSVAHLAGALGKAVWLLLPFSPDWRWLLDREDSPWYPGMRLFRQPEIGDWDSVITTVTAALAPESGTVNVAA